jgi:hypothetical protein
VSTARHSWLFRWLPIRHADEAPAFAKAFSFVKTSADETAGRLSARPGMDCPGRGYVKLAGGASHRIWVRNEPCRGSSSGSHHRLISKIPSGSGIELKNRIPKGIAPSVTSTFNIQHSAFSIQHSAINIQQSTCDLVPG